MAINTIMGQLIYSIKQKKELRNINDQYVKEQLQRYFQQNSSAQRILESKLNLKSALYKKIVKALRAQLRRYYSLFRSTTTLVLDQSLLQKLKSTSPLQRYQMIETMLQHHASTKERVSFYKELYPKIFAITGKPDAIIDLGCGLNPLSIPWMKLKKITYYAYDLHEQEVVFLNSFFSMMNIKGKAVVQDISRSAVVAALPKADLCFVFKMTDIFDQGKGHKVSELIIKNVPARFVVMSFPLLTMSGKKMNFPRRKWIEFLSQRLGYDYKILEFNTEIFYVLKKW